MLVSGEGIGVKGDIKDLTGLTTYHAQSGHGVKGAHYDLISSDGHLITVDAKNRNGILYYITDKDNIWNLAGRTSPGQAAAVDAQFYASITVDYYSTKLSYTIEDIYSVVHYTRNYDGAFYSETYVVYGDGNGVTTREFSGAVDVVAHEITHGVTETRNPLNYQNQSGALNEAFSDIMGTVVEWWYLSQLPNKVEVGANGATYGQDWLLGEDLFITSGPQKAVRSMANPQAFNQPDHMSEYVTTNNDSGGVHINSGIVNHAFYLLAQPSGTLSKNASGHEPTTTVTGIGMDAAARIFFDGFGNLSFNATLRKRALPRYRRRWTCMAKAPSVQSTRNAWTAVGVYATTAFTSGSGATTGGSAGLTQDATDAMPPLGPVSDDQDTDGNGTAERTNPASAPRTTRDGDPG